MYVLAADSSLMQQNFDTKKYIPISFIIII